MSGCNQEHLLDIEIKKEKLIYLRKCNNSDSKTIDPLAISIINQESESKNETCAYRSHIYNPAVCRSR